MTSLIYSPLLFNISIPLDFSGWAEGRGWAGQKTCSVPSETAAQGRGGSAEEAAAGGRGGTEKGWSSVMIARKEFVLVWRWGSCSMLNSLFLCSLGSRKAEEDRIRKEEEKARRELIKQEYLRKKQQQILEEQGLGKPKSKPKKPRPKSVHREESYSDSGTKCSSTRKDLHFFALPEFQTCCNQMCLTFSLLFCSW